MEVEYMFGFPQKKEKIYAHTEVLLMKLKAWLEEMGKFLYICIYAHIPISIALDTKTTSVLVY